MQLKWLRRNWKARFGMPFYRLHDQALPLPACSLPTRPVYPTCNVRVSIGAVPITITRLTKPASVLLILDRNVDLISMISHGWTYQALVSDCLSLKLNRVTVPQPESALGGGKKKAYDLDSKDFFWAKNAPNPFPQVAEDIDTELNRYKSDAAEITRSTGVSDMNDIAQMSVAF
jgi:hypothetical protein